MSRLARVAAVGAGALLLAGCPAWPMPGQNPDRTGHNANERTITAANVDQLDQRWTWDEHMQGPADVSAPIASAGGIHVTVGCGVVALNPADGSERWATPLAEAENCEAPAGSRSSEPYTVKGSGDAGPSIVATHAFYVPISSRAGNWEYAGRFLNPSTGEPSGALSSLVSAARGSEYVGLSLHEAVLMKTSGMTIRDADGNVRSFTVSTDSLSSGSADLGSVTIGSGSTVFHSGPGAMTTSAGPSTQGIGVRAFAKSEARPGCTVATGHPTIPTSNLECPLWVNPLDGELVTASVLDQASNTLFVMTGAGNLYAVDGATGATLWTATGAGAAPALANGVLWVPTNDGRILTFAAGGCGSATCSPTGSFATGGSPEVSKPAVAGDVVYVTDNGGSVYAFAKAGCATPPCAPLWSDTPGTTWLSSPVVNQGQLYVSTGSSLVAYGLP